MANDFFEKTIYVYKRIFFVHIRIYTYIFPTLIEIALIEHCQISLQKRVNIKKTPKVAKRLISSYLMQICIEF